MLAQLKAGEMTMHPGARGTGRHANVQTQTSGLSEILVHSRQDSLRGNEGVTALALLRLYSHAVDGAAKLFFKIGVWVKGPDSTYTRGPRRKGQCAPMRLIDLLPGLKFRQLRIQN